MYAISPLLGLDRIGEDLSLGVLVILMLELDGIVKDIQEPLVVREGKVKGIHIAIFASG